MSKVDLAFSIEEFQSRLHRVRELMSERSLDLLILDEIEAMTYLTGFGISETLWRACVIPIERPPFMVVRSLDLAPARERSWLSDLLSFKDWEDPVAVLADCLARRRLDGGRVGLEFNSNSQTVARFQQLRTLLPNSTLVDLGRALWELRLKKSSAEVGYLRQAAAIADATMLVAAKAVRPGGYQHDIAKAAAAAFIELGADDGLVGPLTSGSEWDSLHGHMQSDALAEGAIVHVELVPRVRGYSARMMRSVVVGEATAEQVAITARLAELQDRQIEALRPGAVAHEVDRVLREPMVKSGLRSSYDNVTGYMLGAYPYPTLRISDFSRTLVPDATWIVEPGMTMHMYTSARGLALSESVLVTADGPERLTKTVRMLLSTS